MKMTVLQHECFMTFFFFFFFLFCDFMITENPRYEGTTVGTQTTTTGIHSQRLLYIQDIVFFVFFQCKIEFYFTEWTPKAVFSPSENTGFGVHE